MIKREAEFQKRFTKWKRHFMRDGSFAFELKITETGTLPFSRLEEHQEIWLLNAKHSQICYKIPDVGYDSKPFDQFCLGGAKAFVVIMFNYSSGQKEFIMIDIDDFIKEKETSDRKSLTYDRAKEIGTIYHLG